MRRRNDGRAAHAEVLDDGHRQRTALHRIRPGAGFVQENERRKRQRALHLYNVGNVPGERAQALCDRLFVADVSEHRAEYRKLGAAGGGDEQTGLRHERQQPRSLQCDRLAAGVGTGDDQHRHRRNQHDIDGHGLGASVCPGSPLANRSDSLQHLCLGASSRAPERVRVAPRSERVRTKVTLQRRNQQRMPRRSQLEPAVGRDSRTHAVDQRREARTRLKDVEFRRGSDRPLHIVSAAAERVGKGEQDAMDFLRFLLFERHDLVVDLDGAQAARGTGSRRCPSCHGRCRESRHGARRARRARTGHSDP